MSIRDDRRGGGVNPMEGEAEQERRRGGAPPRYSAASLSCVRTGTREGVSRDCGMGTRGVDLGRVRPLELEGQG